MSGYLLGALIGAGVTVLALGYSLFRVRSQAEVTKVRRFRARVTFDDDGQEVSVAGSGSPQDVGRSVQAALERDVMVASRSSKRSQTPPPAAPSPSSS